MLHQFDEFIERIVSKSEEENKGKSPYQSNKTYHNIEMKIFRLKKKLAILKNAGMDLTKERKEYRKYLKLKRRLKSLNPNPGFTKIRYVRYADD